jgi:glycosyltransferase involved in cell wall biosynthesis
MDVSVIIPTFNRAHLLPHTLDAILAQTHRPTDIIVVARRSLPALSTGTL